MDSFQNIFDITGFGSLLNNPGYIIMIIIGCILLFLGISKKYEPLLLVPIGFGIIIANIPNSNLGVVPVDPSYSLIQIATEYGIINLLYYSLIKTGFLPPLIFMGIGALTDFGPMLKNLRLVFFGAAAQIGIFSVLIIASFLGFDNFKRKHKKLRLLPHQEISMVFGSDFQGKKGFKDPNQRKNTSH